MGSLSSFLFDTQRFMITVGISSRRQTIRHAEPGVSRAFRLPDSASVNASFQPFDSAMLKHEIHRLEAIFPGESVTHGFFSRHGGVSTGDFASLNVGLHVGDETAHVLENRERIKRHLGLPHLVTAKQVHGDRIHRVTGGNQEPGEVEGCDALLTNEPGIGLLVQHADCQAVLLHDPRQQAVANIHAGWRGSVLNIIAKTIGVMQKHFDTDPADLLAGISPSLGPCCAEFVNYRQELPPALHPYQVRENHFDFWAISRDQLQATGVQKENIAIVGICTRCNADFFSYRRQKQTGRCGSVIGLR